MGADPVEASLFDPESLRTAVVGHDAVVNLATHIPPLSRASRPEAWAENERIRREGSRNLVDAASACGVTVFVQESLAFCYEDRGEEWIDETTPLVTEDVTGSVETAEANVARFAESGGRGVVLRFGRFYDVTSDHTRAQLRAATLGVSGEVGAVDGYQPLVDVRDAAEAVALALDAPAGVYNVVDDGPLTRREVDAVVARAVGRRRLHRPLDKAPGRLGPSTSLFSRSMRVSNRKFVDATGWRPGRGGSAAGLRRVVAEMGYGDRGLRPLTRVLLWILAVSGIVVGLQALFAPLSFYDDFPLGRGWVAMDGPYNQHLIRDVGAFNLALAAITIVALVIRSPLAAKLAGLGWLVFSVPHAVYHLAHLHGMDSTDAVGIAIGTVGPALIALLVLVAPAHLPRRPVVEVSGRDREEVVL
jgi:nucleoside-diphosphate-sugar epimerase